MHRDAAVQPWLAHFSDPEAVRRYTDGPPRFVPGFADLHRMTRILLAEQTVQDASVLVLGAGGGLELKALAEAEPRWNFVGVDPALAMLKLAEQTLGQFNARVQLQQGYIDDAPDGPFDAATCLLTLHPATIRLRSIMALSRLAAPEMTRSSPTAAPPFCSRPEMARTPFTPVATPPSDWERD
jgi:SAM-dependent methyltransferase